MSKKYHELIGLSDEQVIELYDEIASRTSVGLNYYTAELERRSNEKKDSIMIKCTKQITIMTLIMTLTTIINVIIAVLVYLK